ncbi:tyrosine-type recombinase/integrase [Variovorax sp. J31P207]|uniref:tyrosine-type recombinase/integrase n=1 Tax=Variovorax sp. J31P207 TaxID=3053510 RepID=UPI0025759895|nr:tyrosine-type recombinase/integrase [Variovorax sp. J31P207]MDM0072085.1 tyrosine-type recombinase/integrase [Variovorax sp. J31P207]
MGRKPTRWANLPKGMRARPRGKLIFYYLDTGEKPRREIPLGSDYVAAVSKWAELTSKPAPVVKAPPTFVDALDGYGKVDGYRKDVLPNKAPRTQQDNEKELGWLLKFFGDPPAPLDSIEPLHIGQYKKWRLKAARELAEARNAERRRLGRPAQPIAANVGHVRANREKALFSHIWNYCRENGLTKLPNPCAGVDGFHEEGRDVAPDAETVQKVIDKSGKPLEFALRLADIIGQRPADVLRVTEKSIEGEVPGGILRLRQGKTKEKLRIVVEGLLADLIIEIRAYKRAIEAEHKIYAMALLVNEEGKPLTKAMLRDRFDDARAAADVPKAEFQFRDLRAKAATDIDDERGTRDAQSLLGHTTEGMTANYIRHKVGKKVRPLR